MNKYNKNDRRYPHTYAADLVCSWAGYDKGGMKLSRSDASKIRHKIAEVLGMEDEELAKKLADYYLANQELITDESIKEFLSVVLDKDVNTFSDEAKKVLGISKNLICQACGLPEDIDRRNTTMAKDGFERLYDLGYLLNFLAKSAAEGIADAKLADAGYSQGFKKSAVTVHGCKNMLTVTTPKGKVLNFEVVVKRVK